jgi:hypothetical protein
MNSLLQKYKRKTSSLILIGYFLIFTVGVFHHHLYDFNFTKAFDVENNQSSNHFRILNGKLNDCIIHQNFSNIQTAVANFVNDHQLTKQEQTPLPFSEIYRRVNSEYYLTRLLRAPPEIF